MFFTPLTSKSAKASGAELVPVVGELVPVISEGAGAVVSLLEAIGVIQAVGEAVYVVAQGYGYILDFIDAINPFAITPQELWDFAKKYIPDDLFFWNKDTAKPYVATGEGYRLASGGDLYLKAPEVVNNTRYTTPVNVGGVLNASPTWNGSSRYMAIQLGTMPFSGANNIYIIGINKVTSAKITNPVYITSSQAWTYNGAHGFEVNSWYPEFKYQETIPLNSAWSGGNVWGLAPNVRRSSSDWMTENGGWVSDSDGTWYEIAGRTPYIYSGSTDNLYGGRWYYNGATIEAPSNSGHPFSQCTAVVETALYTIGTPVLYMNEYFEPGGGDLPLPDDSVVRVPDISIDIDISNPSSNSFLPPPEFWQAFKDVLDAMANAGGQNVNNSTTLGDFVNNNYVYNETNVNLPEIPDSFKFQISGSLGLDVNADVNLKGDLNITINENYNPQLPEVTSKDGEDVFDMNAATVVGALTTHNPIFPMIKGVFDNIDPSLKALFVTGVSFLMLLGLWHLIRR